MTPARFLYFLADASALSADTARALGLASRLAESGASPEYTSAAAGPHGRRGVLFTFPGEKEDFFKIPTYSADPTKQTWAMMPAEGKSWLATPPKPSGDLFIGLDLKNPPTASALARPTPWPSHSVPLDNGQTLAAPIGFFSTLGTSALPAQTFLCPDGSRGRRIVPKFARYEEALDLLFYFILDRTYRPGPRPEPFPESLSMEAAERLAADILSLNYRAGLAEWLLLEAFTDKIVREILEAFVDLPSILADIADHTEAETTDATKKNESTDPAPGASASNFGSAASALAMK